MEYPTILVNYWRRDYKDGRHLTNRRRTRQCRRLFRPIGQRSPTAFLLIAAVFCSADHALANACTEALRPADIQGTGEASPSVGKQVRVRGIVTLVDADPDGLGGFFIQGGDSDARASSGIFVHAPQQSLQRFSDVVVTGEVKEYYGLTELAQVENITSCGNSEPPAPVMLERASEALEGMRIQLPASRISDNYRLLDVGELVVTDGIHHWTLEDGSNTRGLEALPWGVENNAAHLANGNELDALTGVLTWRWNRWVVLPEYTPQVRHMAAWSHRPAAPDRLRLASFNIENLFNGSRRGFGTSRGAASAQEWAQQREKVARALLALNSDVVALQEVEHDRGHSPEVLPDLLALMHRLGGRNYAALAPSVRPQDDAITNAFLYDPEQVTPMGELVRIDSEPRPALVQRFKDSNGTEFNVINVHLKSRGRGCHSACAQERATGLAEVLSWLETQPESARWVLAGDFNTLPQEPLWRPLVAQGWRRADVDEPTYWFRGQPQQIDHIWYRNLPGQPEAWVQPGHAEMPPVPLTHPLYDPTLPWGASDHNPVLLAW